jgi:hypothetical protein
MRANQRTLKCALCGSDGRDGPLRKNLSALPAHPSSVPSRRVRAVDDNEHKTKARKDLGILDGIV